MPYRLGTGCHACRARKVKCDETQPSCMRCSKLRQPCPGYREKSDLLFKSMNHISEKKVKHRMELKEHAGDRSDADLRPTSDEVAVTSIKSWQADKDDSLLTTHNNTRFPIAVKRKPWQETVIERFFADYVVHTDVVPENLDIVVEICNRPDHCAYVEEALQAVSFVSQANQLKIDWLSTNAAKHYGRSLLLLAEALKDPKEAKKDTILVAMFLVSLYEAISGHRPSGLLFDLNHYVGRSSILRLRGESRLRSHAERSLFHVTFCQIIYNCMSRNEQPPVEAESWLEHFPYHIPIQVAKCNLRTTRLGAEAHLLFAHYTEDPRSILDLLQILKKGISIELDYQDWCEAATGPHGYRMVRRNSQSLDYLAAKALNLQEHGYDDIWVAHIWNAFRGGRIHLHEVLLHSIDLICTHPIAVVLSDDLAESRAQSRLLVLEMTTDICASTSFSIGSADSAAQAPATEGIVPLGGYFLIWPLHVAINSCESGSEMESFMKEKLGYISDLLGIRVAGQARQRVKKYSWDLS